VNKTEWEKRNKMKSLLLLKNIKFWFF